MQCPIDTLKIHLKIHLRKTLSSKSSVKGHTSPDKNVAGKVFLSEYEMPMSFQASVATFQDNFFKTP